MSPLHSIKHMDNIRLISPAVIWTFTIPGRPVTKKNHQRIVMAGKYPKIIQSEQYLRYENEAGWFLKPLKIDFPVNVKGVYYMPTRHKVDLCNLLAATCDILVKYGVLADDNSRIIFGHDGSRVEYDKDNPRTEIEITKQEGP